MDTGKLKNLAHKAKRVVLTGKFTGKEWLGSKKLGYIKDWVNKNLQPDRNSFEKFKNDINGKFFRINENSRINDLLKISNEFIAEVNKLNERTTFGETKDIFNDVRKKINIKAGMAESDGFSNMISNLNRFKAEQPTRMMLWAKNFFESPIKFFDEFVAKFEKKNPVAQQTSDNSHRKSKSSGKNDSTGTNQIKTLNENFLNWKEKIGENCIKELEGNSYGAELIFDNIKNFKLMWEKGKIPEGKKDTLSFVKKENAECRKFMDKLDKFVKEFQNSLKNTPKEDANAQKVFNILDEI